MIHMSDDVLTEHRGPSAASTGGTAGLLFALFLLLLSGFIWLGDELREAGLIPERSDSIRAGATEPLTGTAISGAGSANRARAETLPGQSRTSPFYEDLISGFGLHLPDGWQRTERQSDASLPSFGDHDLILQDPQSGARFAISSWDAEGLASLPLFLGRIAPGFQPVDGDWQSNAEISGQPALVLWAPDSPTTPARYLAAMEHQGRFICLGYTALDGGAARERFKQLLESMRFHAVDHARLAGDVEGARDTTRLPRLPLPEGRYFPAESLFQGG